MNNFERLLESIPVGRFHIKATDRKVVDQFLKINMITHDIGNSTMSGTHYVYEIQNMDKREFKEIIKDLQKKRVRVSHIIQPGE